MSRRLGRTAFATFVSFAVTGSAALSATLGVPVVVGQPGDLSVEEVAAFAEIYWHHRDTGELLDGADDFSFGQPDVLGSGAVVFFNAYIVFEQVYAHLLDNDPDSPGYYTIHDLLEDDPEVMDKFRHFTLTGELTIGPEDGNGAAFTNHLGMLVNTEHLDPDLLDPCYEISDITVSENFELTSFDLKKKKDDCDDLDPYVDPDLDPDSGPGPDDPDDTIDPDDPTTDNLPDDVKNPVDDFPLKHFPPPHLPPDGWFFRPGFDCDDWADCMGEYLRRHYEGHPDFENYTLWMTWYGDGHVST
ncbi:MAG: hypothetical protein AAGD00_00075 [Planctomycetota bacterium]